MDEPGKQLELAVPDRLTRLASAGFAVTDDLPGLMRRHPARRVDVTPRRVLAPLGPTDEARVRRVLRAELSESRSAYMRPWWIEPEDAVPGLVVSLRYSHQDAHGIAQYTRDLDLAFRRAAATLESFYAGRRNLGWAYPMRPERGGLWILDTRRGSYELLATVYGSLVLWATSAPVSLASLVSLSWESAVRAARVGRWAVSKFGGSPDDGPPQLGSSHGADEWGVKQTKALQPVMLEAAKAGSGLEFVNNTATGEVRLTIYPNSELTAENGEE